MFIKPSSSSSSSSTATSDDFDRVNLFLFQFLSHQIHPYAYAVKTFLHPALEKCIEMIPSNPQDTFQLVLSLIKTFLRFIPEPDLIFDEIQQFATRLNETLNQCFASLNTKTNEDLSKILDAMREGLKEIIERTDEQENTNRIAMYKHIKGILTDLEKKYEKVNQTDCVEIKMNEKPTENDERMRKSPSMFESTLNSSQQSKDEEPIEEKPLPVSKFRVDAPPYQPIMEIPPGFEFVARQNNVESNVIWSNGDSTVEHPISPIDLLQNDQIRPRHVTDRYFQESTNRSGLFGRFSMNYGEPQFSPQTDCLPIGVALSYDESILLSCDVHRNSESVRLFDVQTGRLKHKINSHQNMKMHRPSAVMSTANDNIVIVEKEMIHLTTADGRWIQTITDRSIKKLYGIALFHDRYLLTLDSKSIGEYEGELCRLLLFDPAYGHLVSEQILPINHQPEGFFRSEAICHAQGKILHENHSKPRFLAVHGDKIYVADLGRSVVYGLRLTDPSGLTCTTIFGGHGRESGEMVEPSGLCIDSGGNVINADSRNDRIQIFSSDGDFRSEVHLNEHIRRPSGICLNRDGTQLYVSCYLAGCVRSFELVY